MKTEPEAPARSPTTGIIFAVTLLGTLLVGWGSPVNSWLIFNVGLFLLWIPVLGIPHGLALAAAARIVGLRVFFLEIGVGPAVFETRIGGTRLSVHTIPVSGRTAFASKAGNWHRARPFAALLFGPAIHLLLAACPIAVLGWDGFEDQAWNMHFFHSPMPWSAFVFANLAFFVGSIIPRSTEGLVPPMPSAGARLLQLLSDPEGSRTEYLTGYFILEGFELARERRYEDAIAAYERGLREFPDSLQLRLGRAVAVLKAGRLEEARSTLLELLESPEAREEGLQHTTLENNVAYSDVLLAGDDPDSLTRADEISSQALKRYPRLAGLHSTRGAVLLRQGHPREATVLLKRAFQWSTAPDERCGTAAWLAIAHSQLGEFPQADRWLARARAHPALVEVRMAESEVARALEVAESNARAPGSGEPEPGAHPDA